MTAAPVRALLVGYGYWGRRLLDIAGRVDTLRVVGVVDERAGSEDFRPPGSLPCRPDLDGALTDDSIEALVVTVPAVRHAPLAEQSLRAGKHVFVEKPLAIRASDARALVRLAHDRELMLTVDHQYWWTAEMAALAAALGAGEVGRLVAVSVQRVSPGPARQDVSAWWDLACHDVAMLTRLGVLSAEPDRGVRLRGCTAVPDGDVAGCVVVLGCDADGVELWFHACWMSGVRRRRLVLTGESGSLSLEEDDDALALWLERHGERDLLSRTEKCDRGTPIEGALRAFADGVQGTPDLRAAADAVTVVSVLEQVSEASRARLSVVPAPGCWL